jgi:hypothetical protein
MTKNTASELYMVTTFKGDYSNDVKKNVTKDVTLAPRGSLKQIETIIFDVMPPRSQGKYNFGDCHWHLCNQQSCKLSQSQ